MEKILANVGNDGGTPNSQFGCPVTATTKKGLDHYTGV